MRITDLTYQEVRCALLKLGFAKKRTRASHEQWIGYRDAKKYLVTVDKPQSPYGVYLINSMAIQAGLSKSVFYRLCKHKFDLNKSPELRVVSQPSIKHQRIY